MTENIVGVPKIF